MDDVRNQDVHSQDDAPQDERKSTSVTELIVTWAVIVILFVGTAYRLLRHFSPSLQIMIIGLTALVMALLFLMAKYMVYSAQKEKQKREYQAHHDQPIR